MSDFLADAGVIYKLGEDGLSITAELNKSVPLPEILKTDNLRYEYYGKNVTRLNRGIRREDTMLFAGVLPCFSMGTINHDAPGHMPPIAGMGEFHFGLRYKGKDYSFDEADRIKAEFLPNGTKWNISFEFLHEAEFSIYVSLTGDYGIAAAVIEEGAIPEGLTLICTVAEPRIGDHVPEYFSDKCKMIKPTYGDIISDETGSELFCSVISESGDPEYRRCVAYGFSSTDKPEISAENVLNIELPLSIGSHMIISAVHCPYGEQPDSSKLCRNSKDVLTAIFEEEDYYNNYLKNIYIRTDDICSDAGIRWAALNLDYVHVGNAWLEGGQWWNVHFTNNYQLSAAAALSQYGRVRKALDFFANLPDGYSVIALNEESLDRWGRKDGTKAIGFDGIPYYLWQLWLYVQSTGDISAVSDNAERILRMCDELLDVCDPDRDSLLSWNRGVNPFMYQGDHLSVPGAGASPSVMMAGNLARFGKLLETAGLSECAARYNELSRKIFNALPRLWDSDRGFFYSCIDLRGTPCLTHYYTDYVFPVLYADSLPIEQQILPLAHLRDKLIYESPVTGKLLMHVGEYKPDLFGNNNVMPVQIAETARAFFKIGDYDTGYELLSSCGYANSVFTENPGSSPEKLNSIGKGEPDYMFGNPAASVTYTAVSGLMGINITDFGQTLSFEPGFPLSMKHWEFGLSSVSVTCDNNLSSDGCITYRISLKNSSVKRLKFGLFVPVCDTVSVPGSLIISANGTEIKYGSVPALNSHKIELIADKVNAFTELKLQFSAPVTFESRALGRGFTNKTEYIANGEIKGNLYRLYYDESTDSYGLLKLVSSKSDSDNVRTGYCTLSSPEHVDISELLTNDWFPAFNAWRFGSHYKIRPTSQTRTENGISVTCGDISYNAVPVSDDSDAVRVCTLSYGRSDIVGGTVTPSEFPSSVIVPVGAAVSAVSLLYISESEVWLSGNEQMLGKIILHYEDSSSSVIPLISCKNMGSVLNNYTEEPLHVPLREHPLDSANHYCIECDMSRKLEKLEIRIEKEDTYFGLMGMNIVKS